MRKKIAAISSFLILIIVMIFLVLAFKPESVISDKNKIQIVATLFPQYDFAKQIVGDKAEVTLLVGSGVETHNFEPTAQDMVKMLDNTDLFLYTGTFLEPWTEDIIKTLEESNCKIVDVSKNIELIKIEEFEERYINNEINHEEHSAHEEEEHVHTELCNHQDMYDGHIWQSLDNANIMIENVLNAVCQIDPENTDYYKENAKIISDTMKECNIWFVGGKHSPYIWLKCPNNMSSWDFFDYLLNNIAVVGTPGAGFGKNGEGYFRLTSFGSRENTIEAMNRFKSLFTLVKSCLYA